MRRQANLRSIVCEKLVGSLLIKRFISLLISLSRNNTAKDHYLTTGELRCTWSNYSQPLRLPNVVDSFPDFLFYLVNFDLLNEFKWLD